MNIELIFQSLTLADGLIKTGKEIYQHLQDQTGKTVEEIRAQRDALSNETHAIIDSELADIEASLEG